MEQRRLVINEYTAINDFAMVDKIVSVRQITQQQQINHESVRNLVTACFKILELTQNEMKVIPL